MTRIEIVNADSTEGNPEFWAQFDVLVCDAPYSHHVHANMASVGVVGGGMGAHARDPGFGHLTPKLRLCLAYAAASVKRWSVLFSDHEDAHKLRIEAEEAGAEYIRTVPWIRWSQPQLSGDRPPTGSEAVLHFHRQKVGAKGGRSPIAKHWNGPGSLTHYSERCLRGKDKHPTEKPLDLILSIVSWFSDPGELVLDMCGGRGTTAQACRLLGRGCTSIEVNPEESLRAQARLHEPLSDRDRARVTEWCEKAYNEASGVPVPKADDGSDVKTWERAQRRLADVERVLSSGLV